DPSECIDRGVDRGVDVGALRDVAAHGDRLVADRRRSLARGLPIDIDDGNARTLAREGGGNALAEARCRAGDERNLLVETHAPSSRGTTCRRPADQLDLTPSARAQPRPSSVLARGRYSQPTHLP